MSNQNKQPVCKLFIISYIPMSNHNVCWSVILTDDVRDSAWWIQEIAMVSIETHSVCHGLLDVDDKISMNYTTWGHFLLVLLLY